MLFFRLNLYDYSFIMTCIVKFLSIWMVKNFTSIPRCLFLWFVTCYDRMYYVSIG